MTRCLPALFLCIALSSSVRAQEHDALPPAFAMPWSEAPPEVRGEEIVAVAIGEADARFGRLSARRAASRRAAEARARAAIHRWADDALAAIAASPRTAARVHRAIDAGARARGIRPLADGSAVVEVVLPVAALREVAAARGLPWAGGAP